MILLWMVQPLQVSAAADGWLNDPAAIAKMLHSIPAIGGDLGSRFGAGAMLVEAIRIHKLTRQDAADDPGHRAAGDIEMMFLTKGDPSAPGCTIMGSPTIIKRNERYLPQDRTSIWLLTGKCAAPE